MDTIDYDKYYKRDNDGCYTVHFANNKKLSIDEIEEIFSAYGKVMSVNITEHEYGFRFVKYKTLEEIICCLKGLKNSDIIQLLPERIKMNGSNRRLKYNSTPRKRLEYSFQKTSDIDNQFNLNSAHNRRSSEIENLTHSTSTSNVSQLDNADNFSDTASRSSHNLKSNVNAIKHDKSDPLISNSLFSGQQNSISNSSETDYYKYYKIGKDGNYIVHFVNKKELSINEIRTLFSSYGNVVSVYVNGEKINGLVFVRYRSLEETITCLKELQNNDMINILPQKDKINGTVKKTDQENSNHGQLAEMQDSFQGINRQFDSNSNCDKKFSKPEEKLTPNTSDRNRFHSTKNFLNTDFESLNDDNKSAITHSDFLISDKQISRQRSFNNYEVTNYNQEQQHKSKFHSFAKPDININVNKNVSDDKILPLLISDMEIKQKQFDAVSNSSSQWRDIPIIIVANIHASYDVHHILHLFKKYNPISARVVKTILGTNKRYCYVYFKTIQDAITVEEEFDNFDLSDKKLIVLRMSRLEDAACK